MRGAEEAEMFWEEAYQELIPLTIITPTPQRLHQAAQLKGRYLCLPLGHDFRVLQELPPPELLAFLVHYRRVVLHKTPP